MNKLRILGIDYSVIFRDGIQHEGSECHGLADLDHQIIYIDKSNSSQMQTTAIIHEIIEAINYQLELKLKHNQIMSLECGIFQSLKEKGVDLSVLIEEDEEEQIVYE